jgi:hypothetical protein
MTIMKPLRFPFIFLICIGLVLMPGTPLGLRAQNKPADGKKVFDTYATVIGAAYPAIGVMFKATGEMLDLFGYFGKGADPVGDELKRINNRLLILDQRMSDLENGLKRVQNEQMLAENRDRVRFLKDRHQEIQDLVDELQRKATDSQAKRILASKAQRIAGRFLDDPDMDIWKWSDLRLRDQVMMPADFKPMPALEYYGIALVTWMAAIDNATDGEYEFVKRTYGPELQKHIAFLSVRKGWNDLGQPQTLPENIMTRVSCTMEPLFRQSQNRKCLLADRCEDQIARVSTSTTQEVIMPQNSDLCNVPVTASARGSEAEMERMYGTEVMAKLAEKLSLIKDRGTVREGFVGTFDPSTQTAEFLYAVQPNGDLLWYMHRVVTTKTGLPVSGAQPSDDSIRARDSSATRVLGSQPAASGSAAASTSRVRPATLPKSKVTHVLDGPKRVGSGWQNFRAVMPAGLSGVYALTNEGNLLWYKQNGYETGDRSWSQPRQVGSGWGDFKQIIPMGDGIVYALRQDGKLIWYKHIGYETGERSWSVPVEVGSGWADFKQVFAGGGGVMYAVTNEGVLKWYRNKSYMTGVKDWEGPKDVGTGWQNFKTILSPGDGVIYAMRPTGELVWYKHDGYNDGSVRWQSAVEIAADWKDFLFVFSRMPGTYTPPVVR